MLLCPSLLWTLVVPVKHHWLAAVNAQLMHINQQLPVDFVVQTTSTTAAASDDNNRRLSFVVGFLNSCIHLFLFLMDPG